MGGGRHGPDDRGEDGDTPTPEDEAEFVRDVNVRFYARVEARKSTPGPSAAAAIFYDSELSDAEKFARLTALREKAMDDAPEAADIDSHLASLDATRGGGIV